MASTRPLVHSSTRPLVHSSTRPLVHSSTRPLVHSSTRPLVHSSTRPLVHSSTRPLVHSSTRPLVHSSTRPLVHSSTRPLVHSSINRCEFYNFFWIDCKRKIFPKDLKFLKNVIIVYKQIQFYMPNMTCFLFSHARDLHAKFKARPGKNTEPKRCPFCPISPRKSPINFVLTNSFAQ